MTVTTFSGPSATVREARRLLTEAGYFVMSAPARIGYEPEPGEAFLSIDTGESNAAGVIEHLGWRHRATTGRQGDAVRIGRIGGDC